MIATALKHYLYDIGIGLFFEGIRSNFATYTKSYVGGYWLAADEEGVVAYGKCIEQRGNLVVLDDGDSETIINTNLYKMVSYSYTALILNIKRRTKGL